MVVSNISKIILNADQEQNHGVFGQIQLKREMSGECIPCILLYNLCHSLTKLVCRFEPWLEYLFYLNYVNRYCCKGLTRNVGFCSVGLYRRTRVFFWHELVTVIHSHKVNKKFLLKYNVVFFYFYFILFFFFLLLSILIFFFFCRQYFYE